jgi:hypothetical protein
MKGSATSHMATNIAYISAEWVTSQEKWPALSPDLNPYEFYLWVRQ